MRMAAMLGMLAALAGWGGLSRGVAEHLTPVRNPVLWIAGGWAIQGTSDDGLRQGLLMCLFHRDPLLPGSCAEEVFVDELPMRRVWISAYGLDRTEVPQEAYQVCVLEGACAPTRLSDHEGRISAPDHPVAGVTWEEARRYCRFRGGRLPTEAEWERAARGGTSRTFPWGHVYNDRLANHGRHGDRPDDVDGYRYAAPVGSFPRSASPFGALDMAGNVWEWTADIYAPDTYRRDLQVDPRGPEESGDRVVRGGSWRSAPHTLRTTYRAHRSEGGAFADVGFRCAYDGR